VAQEVEHLHSKHEALNSDPSTTNKKKTLMVGTRIYTRTSAVEKTEERMRVVVN
jgi:hypothetical protein